MSDFSLVHSAMDMEGLPRTKSNSELFEQMYQELRSIAGSVCFSVPTGATLQPTALVNEVYLRLSKSMESKELDRNHLLSIAATAMRQVCIDYARAMQTKKRGDGWKRITISNVSDAQRATLYLDLVHLEQLLVELGNYDQRQLRIVELRFFGGMTTDQISQVLGISPKRVELDWRMAKAWLATQLEEVDDGS